MSDKITEINKIKWDEGCEMSYGRRRPFWKPLDVAEN